MCAGDMVDDSILDTFQINKISDRYPAMESSTDIPAFGRQKQKREKVEEEK